MWDAKGVAEELGGIRRDLSDGPSASGPAVTEEGVDAWLKKVTKTDA